jgi:hypothetical protein
MQEEGLPGGEAVSDTDVVYVAAHPRVNDGRKDVVCEARMMASGKPAGIAFTSIKHLVEALGQAQPWVAMPLGRFREVMATGGIADVALNPKVPHEAVRWQPQDVQEFIARGRT